VILSGSIPLEPINETIGILQKQLFYLTVVLVVLAMLISAFFAKYFIRPISLLNRSVKRIAEGDLETRVNIHSKDEFGMLADNFNHMAQSLSKVDRLRKDLVANVSHELRTPLGIIKGYAELTRDIQGELPQRRTSNMNLIIEEVDRLSEVVDDILDFSQIQSGYMNLNKVSMSPSARLMNAFDKYSLMAREKGVELLLELYDEDVEIQADIQRIDQVLHNFIGNAMHHTEQGGTVIIRGERQNSGVIISIIDDGVGIPGEALDHIWERYYKVVNDGNRRGTGLGLSIAKHILDAHGYKYGVESEVGVGSRFYFEMK
jgi:signal transduction histidine kinase